MSKNRSLATLFLNDSAELLDQSLLKIENCLGQLSVKQIWWRADPEGNSIGNLVLHICGNLRQWSVAGVGGQPDTRDRDDEFSPAHNLTSDQLLQIAKSHIQECKSLMESLEAETLTSEFTIQGFQVNGLQALNHTITHFVGHTHQIICITRMLLGATYQFAWSPKDGREQLPI